MPRLNKSRHDMLALGSQDERHEDSGDGDGDGDGQ